MKVADDYYIIIFSVLFRSHFTCEYRLPFTANIEPLCGISIAPLAQISIYLNIPSSTVAATTVPRSSAEPPPFRHAKGVPPFPLSGKSTPPCFANGGRSVECVGLPQKGCERRRARTITYVTETKQPRSGKAACYPIYRFIIFISYSLLFFPVTSE